MDLKALLAAKKAAAAEQNKPTPAMATSIVQAMGLVVEAFTPPEPAPATPVVATVPEAIKPEPESVTVSKPMSFAERMAEKKRLAAQSTQAPAAVPAPTREPLVQTHLSFPAPEAPKQISLSDEQTAQLREIESEELAQAYSDLALTINRLKYTEEGNDLSNAMADLKQAIRKNASAAMYLLDSDIGQMTLALRRYTHTEVTEAASEKEKAKPGRKPKAASTTPLTAEQIAAALEDM